MYDANTHYLLMQRLRSRRRIEPAKPSAPLDKEVSKRIHPDMIAKEEEKPPGPSRMDRILRDYGGTGPGSRHREEPRSYDPEIV